MLPLLVARVVPPGPNAIQWSNPPLGSVKVAVILWVTVSHRMPLRKIHHPVGAYTAEEKKVVRRDEPH